jgi:hypothetical protein
MLPVHLRGSKRTRVIAGIAACVIAVTSSGIPTPVHAGEPDHDRDRKRTETPIKHLIVLIGENRTFDNVYGTYVPKPGQKVWNLLSRGIVDANGAPAANKDAARQFQVGTINPVSYFISTNKLINPNKTVTTAGPATMAAGGIKTRCPGGVARDMPNNRAADETPARAPQIARAGNAPKDGFESLSHFRAITKRATQDC